MVKLKQSTHRGKLEGIKSISTNKLQNCYCMKKHCKLSICNFCYVNHLNKFYGSTFINALTHNSDILMNDSFTPYKLSAKLDIMRFNSFGELHNITHLDNIVKICNENKHVHFTLWSKRRIIVKEYFDNHSIPGNLTLIYSNPIIDKDVTIPKYFHKVFNVITDKNDNRVNCGKRKCRECMLCYGINSINSTSFIYEVIK